MVQESDGFSNFTFSSSNPKVATAANFSTSGIAVTSFGAGKAIITVMGDKKATAKIYVTVTTTELHVNFINTPTGAAWFDISSEIDQIFEPFLYPSPLHYAFVAYNLGVEPIAPSETNIIVILYDGGLNMLETKHFRSSPVVGMANVLYIGYSD